MLPLFVIAWLRKVRVFEAEDSSELRAWKPQCAFRRVLTCLLEVSVLSAIFFVARPTGSLARGFLVAVVGYALIAVVWVL